MIPQSEILEILRNLASRDMTELEFTERIQLIIVSATGEKRSLVHPIVGQTWHANRELLPGLFPAVAILCDHAAPDFDLVQPVPMGRVLTGEHRVPDASFSAH